jgi:hypothetical protein
VNIDGEVVVPAADGAADFSVLQNELKANSDSIVMGAFAAHAAFRTEVALAAAPSRRAPTAMLEVSFRISG